MTDDRMQLTRRKILAGTAAVGAAGVGAGLGTSALFSDEESFEDNSITAGAFNLRVTVDNIAHSTEIVRDNVTISPKDTADGAAVTVEIGDVKPGDWLLLEWNPEILANPGYVQVTSVDEDYSNDEGENPESETDTSSPGDLGGELLSTIWQTYDDVSGGNSLADLEGLDETTDLNNSGLSSYEEPTNIDGETPGGAHYTTMDEAHDVYKTGVTLRDTNGDPMVVGSNSDGQAAYFYQLLHVPVDVGNDIQGDELTWTLRFEAEQARNNEAPFESAFSNNPWLAEAQTDSGGVFWNQPGDDTEIPITPGDTFESLPQPGQPIYVNTTDESIGVDVLDGDSGSSVTLDIEAFDGSDFDEVGTGAPWVRIPTGIGTPHPDYDGNHEFVGVSETSGGFEVEWSPV